MDLHVPLRLLYFLSLYESKAIETRTKAETPVPERSAPRQPKCVGPLVQPNMQPIREAESRMAPILLPDLPAPDYAQTIGRYRSGGEEALDHGD